MEKAILGVPKSKMDDSILVPENYYEEGNPTHRSEQQETHSTRNNKTAPNVSQDEVVRVAVLVGRAGNAELTAASIVNKWLQYCHRNRYDIKANTITLLNFLAEKYLTLSVLSFLVQVGIGGGSKVLALHKTAKNNRFGIEIGTIIEGP